MRRLLTSYLILRSSLMTTFIDSFFIDLYKNRRKANYKILNVFFNSVVILMSFSMHHRFVPVHVLEKPEFCCLHALQIPKLLRLSYE